MSILACLQILALQYNQILNREDTVKVREPQTQIRLPRSPYRGGFLVTQCVPLNPITTTCGTYTNSILLVT